MASHTYTHVEKTKAAATLHYCWVLSHLLLLLGQGEEQIEPRERLRRAEAHKL